MSFTNENSERTKIVFVKCDGVTQVLFQHGRQSIGYLDLDEEVKTILETANSSVELTVDPNDITFTIDRFALNCLTDADEFFGASEKSVLQFSLNENIVKFDKCYFFVHELFAKKLRQLANSYAKPVDEIAFSFKRNDMLLCTDNQTMTLRNSHQRLKRQFDVHFGPFEINEVNRNNNFKRYVIDELGRFIQIDKHHQIGKCQTFNRSESKLSNNN